MLDQDLHFRRTLVFLAPNKNGALVGRCKRAVPQMPPCRWSSQRGTRADRVSAEGS